MLIQRKHETAELPYVRGGPLPYALPPPSAPLGPRLTTLRTVYTIVDDRQSYSRYSPKKILRGGGGGSALRRRPSRLYTQHGELM